jgi:hypothetical protein
MEFEKIGSLAINNDRVRSLFPEMQPGTYQAINDVSIADAVSVGPYLLSIGRLKPYATIPGIEQILSG